MSETKVEKNSWFKSYKKFPLGIGLFLLGAFIVLALRFALIQDTSVHYHANFALYVNGQRDEFKSFTYYEEVAACSLHDPDDMKTRVHMHDQNPTLIHVHAHAVTWGQFFANLGYTLGDNVVATDKNVYANGQDENKLIFMLNGQKTEVISDKVIKSEDVLLINYGKDDDKTLKDRYGAIPRTAHQANVTADPSTCSGSEPFTFTNRLKRAIGLDSDH